MWQVVDVLEEGEGRGKARPQFNYLPPKATNSTPGAGLHGGEDPQGEAQCGQVPATHKTLKLTCGPAAKYQHEHC